MKTFLRYTAWLVTASILVSVFAFLYLKTRSLDASHRSTVNGLVRDLKQLDADWNVEVLRSKTGLSMNYDLVTQPQIRALGAEKAIAAQSSGLSDVRLQEAQRQLKAALVSKIDLIDQFKAQNAILRNSMRFIPLAADDLKAKARAAAASTPTASRQMAALENGVEEILIETLKLGNTTDSVTIGRIRQNVGPLVERRSEYPEPVVAALGVFVNHLVTILAQKEREEELFAQLGKLPVVERIDAVSSAFDAAFERAGANREMYRVSLLAYSGFLLVLFAFLGWRMRKSYLEINRLNLSLVRANEVLRQKAVQAV